VVLLSFQHFQIESFAITPSPFGIRFRGTIEFLKNMTLAFVVAPAVTPSATGLMLKIGWDQNGLDQLLQQLLGVMYPAVAICRVKKFSLAIITDTIDLTPFPILSDNGADDKFSTGVEFTMNIWFDKTSPNKLQQFLASFLEGSLIMKLKITEA
jgi:hypothetical protein